MSKLGVSVYPERSTFEKDAAYLDLAAKYGFKRVFTSLLEIKGDQDEVVTNFKKVIAYANKLGLDVMVDVNPDLFKQLGVSYDDLSFFHDLGAWGVRLDLGFTGQEEARMTHNPYGIKIEVNMSKGTHYVDTIMDYSPEKDNLLGSHNFYPQEFTGLGYDYFIQTSEQYRQYGINTAAFVSSNDATYGPWPMQDGLCTLEQHRGLDLAAQVQHLKMTGLIDDVLIGNAYASEAELKAAAEVFFSPLPLLHMHVAEGISKAEHAALFDQPQTYRGDFSDFVIRSSETRVIYKNEAFPAHHTNDVKVGDVLIDNDEFGQYKGELQIARRDFKNTGRINVVGHIVDNDRQLLSLLAPWADFQLIAAN
ncbi:PTS-associated protein [Lactiplantibacillus fabifermentans T30PCM01]|uniref:PTS-associated protein n=1 Tax=Lactiplantibacillus fabifermentans T30PCM01 TaxID=1400520 RepID=W6T5Z8_9LACO|nr:MupG family TIM beta-alpha barrel fold protein [Lactiplantibacillus fabifermentans]ETY73434.1 PTS-associated protein [Lactiplantibacillus fabifermentans T30PCM01]